METRVALGGLSVCLAFFLVRWGQSWRWRQRQTQMVAGYLRYIMAYAEFIRKLFNEGGFYFSVLRDVEYAEQGIRRTYRLHSPETPRERIVFLLEELDDICRRVAGRRCEGEDYGRLLELKPVAEDILAFMVRELEARQFRCTIETIATAQQQSPISLEEEWNRFKLSVPPWPAELRPPRSNFCRAEQV